MNANDIVAPVRLTLLDPQGEFWTTPELIGYLNEGQRQIAYMVPEANAIAETKQLDGVEQTLPKFATRLLDIPSNIDGPAITAVDRRDLDRMVPGWPQFPADGDIQHYMYDERFPKVFHVYPPADKATVHIVYAASLKDVENTSDQLSIGVQYRAPLIEYVLYRAHSKDTQASVPQRAAAHYQQFMAMLGAGQQSEKAVAAGEPDPHNPRELR